MFQWDSLWAKLNELWPKALFAIVLVLIGYALSKLVLKMIQRGLRRSRVEPTYHSFFLSIIKVTLYAVIAFVGLTTIGIPAASLVTVFGAAGLALSLAVKDSLANLAGGILILVSHPFGVGDYIEVGGEAGTVKSINLLYTRLNTPDNKVVFIPNGQVSSDTIVNYSAEENRRLDMVFSVGYQDNLGKAKEIIARVLQENPLALNDPAPTIRVGEQAPSSINIDVKVWVPKDSYWDLRYDLNEQIKQEFDRAGITIPFPQLSVNMPSKE